ncbi:MAG: hypothetical protein CL908_09285 [Deltaproteobacteria bacterium]|jgi:predicted DsbA family dithiol-disulfide isomerase|nr:hypothetical protein [Deltaproteobacteria bacterium]
MPGVVGFIAWSDYLCPWCWVASQRLERLVEEFRGRVEIEWQSYLLRPTARGPRDLERFRTYTESWLRPGAESDVGPFRVWASQDPPPSHSVPAQCVAKAAARHSSAAFRLMHARIMEAYFSENRDISSFDVLRELWEGQGLPSDGFALALEGEIEALVVDEFSQAREAGVTGVPAIRRIDNDAVIVGAHPEELYRRWIERSLERGEGFR